MDSRLSEYKYRVIHSSLQSKKNPSPAPQHGVAVTRQSTVFSFQMAFSRKPSPPRTDPIYPLQVHTASFFFFHLRIYIELKVKSNCSSPPDSSLRAAQALTVTVIFAAQHFVRRCPETVFALRGSRSTGAITRLSPNLCDCCSPELQAVCSHSSSHFSGFIRQSVSGRKKASLRASIQPHHVLFDLG